MDKMVWFLGFVSKYYGKEDEGEDRLKKKRVAVSKSLLKQDNEFLSAQ